MCVITLSSIEDPVNYVFMTPPCRFGGLLRFSVVICLYEETEKPCGSNSEPVTSYCSTPSSSGSLKYWSLSELLSPLLVFYHGRSFPGGCAVRSLPKPLIPFESTVVSESVKASSQLPRYRVASGLMLFGLGKSVHTFYMASRLKT